MPQDIFFDAVLPRVKAGTKELALAMICREIGLITEYKGPRSLQEIIPHDKEGKSEVGLGLSITHTRAAGLGKRYIGLATLNKPLDLETYDGVPVDVVCLLISPQEDGVLHLQALSKLSRLLKSPSLLNSIREIDDADAIRSVLHNPNGWLLAA